MESYDMEVSTLQAMLLIEHIGYHTSTRHDYQKAEIIHAMLVTFCRQSRLLVQNATEFGILQEDLEEKWKTWVKHETSIRLAYCLFVSDIGHSIHCIEPSLLSTEMLNLPLPSLEKLWQAKTANEWATLINLNQEQKPKTLQTLIKVVFPENIVQPTHDISFYSLPSSPDMFTTHILIHAIASAVLDHQNRSTHCVSSHAVSLLEMEDFKLALERWHHHFSQIDIAKQKTKMGASALVTYHFTWILLHHDLSPIQLAAGSTLAVGISSDLQGTQDASSSLLMPRRISNSSFLHALEIIDICLSNPTEESLQVSLDKQHDINPLYRNYSAFLGVMVAWAYTISRSLQHLSRVTVTARPSAPSLLNQSGSDGSFLHPTLEDYRGRNEEALPLAWKSESGRTKVNMQDLNATKDDVYKLMEKVRERLARSSWILAQESSQILDGLLHNASLI
jgi:Fungal specific transcription factor domain